ncbi:glutamine--fructose-6-phosphate transaminase [Ectothiorhodosinus mongolicus]|uniref:Glutamine--fructose-6-phosphate aminotransferase [isomerizing] n=1 Tax=Ectothiorhodosinus mongolicus TaxID=233100 RepID=A0A1R3VVG9_9GAMM|nr:glutamine--fructose-6-phosphate transaminase (isomerizing) [Ectothiorhodosinus mongolicus]ULX56928.1 glutamine--fructose-6-phosphate transaminase (isomerizing) [Ectothiorhodosinus mongolicus]SIT69031.1 glutamine--fructose-6-phosphate transaminase [Ectothiorhodosinus mongolicus]
MCGIIGAIAQRPVEPILIEGLRRLEYRGYDSAGLAVIDGSELHRQRAVGKVEQLAQRLAEAPLAGHLGIAHTRWATHGKPSEANAHPHLSEDRVAVVHNGIIENYAELREQLTQKGYHFASDTDTEVIAHQIMEEMRQGLQLLDAVRSATAKFKGAYALGVISPTCPDRLIAVRQGSPLVIGLGISEHFIASDIQALLPVTQRFIYLENGDLAEVCGDTLRILDAQGSPVDRPVHQSGLSAGSADRGQFRHFMLKEIHEQPQAVAETLEGRLGTDAVLDGILGPGSEELLARVRSVQILACGTSYHAGLVASLWIEGLLGLPCRVEVASEFRYRRHAVMPDCLLVTISQSGETADTLAALRRAKTEGYLGSVSVCNVPESSLVRESDLVLMTHAGPEIGVASTKAFTTQLVALLLFTLSLGRHQGLDATLAASLVDHLRALPKMLERALELDAPIEQLSTLLADKHNALFLGRGGHYPIALEGALKLKEISYIHAEAYPAGELKHGPLALVDADMPVIVVAPNNRLLEKLKSNLQEVRARGGELLVFTDDPEALGADAHTHVLSVPSIDDWLSPIIHTIPLQLLAYHTAVLKGTDVDQPRNLAKSVTVE